VVPVRTKDDVANSIRKVAKDNGMIPFVQLELRGRKIEELTETELKTMETMLLNNLKKSQIKN
jgi:hypothetical protein